MQRALSTAIVASLLALSWAAETAQAYPIPPKPLWPLTADANLVVVAKVMGVQDYEGDEDSWYSAIATLNVLETWKGESQGFVDVVYEANLTCPAPAQYSVGETVVAFLAWNNDESAWTTVSLSYGTLYPKGKKRDDMAAMVKAAVEIQSADLTSEELKRAKLDWLVRAAALPGTRWHGLFELQPEGDPVRSFYARGHQPVEDELSEAQLTVLAETFLRHPAADYTSVMMVRALRPLTDPRVDELTLGMVEAGLELDETPGWLPGLMVEVLWRHGDPAPSARLEEVHQHYWKITEGQFRRLWSEAKGQLGIRDVAPTELNSPRYLPVGGRTPS